MCRAFFIFCIVLIVTALLTAAEVAPTMDFCPSEGKELLASMLDEYNRTIVHLAATDCSHNGIENAKTLSICQIMLSAGMLDSFGQTPLEIAVKITCIDTVNLFLANGMDCTRKNREGFTPLHLAKHLGYDLLFDNMLLTGKCSLEQEDACGVKAKQIRASSEKRCEIVPPIENAEFVGEISPCPGSVVEFTCPSGHVLRGNGSAQCTSDGFWEVSGYCDDSCEDPIHLTGEDLPDGQTRYKIGSERVIKCKDGWKKIGAKSAFCGLDGQWQVNTICQYDDVTRLYQEILKQPSELKDLQILLRDSAKTGDVDLLIQILQIGVLDLNLKDDGAESEQTGWGTVKHGTALIYAAHANPTNLPETVRDLVDYGADVNAKEDEKGFSAITYAIGNGQLEIVTFLLDRKADINTKANNGWTLLMFAAKENKPDIVRLLKSRGASLEGCSTSFSPNCDL